MDADRSLLDPAVVRALERWRVALRRRIEGARAGPHASLRRGASVEFAEHRAYAHGDDPRRIDWNAFARLGDLVVRLFVADEDVTVHVVLDGSRSMAAQGRFDDARRLAAALGYVCLTGSERVTLTVASSGGATARAPWRGRHGVAPMLAALGSLRPDGVAAMGRAFDLMRARHGSRPGVAVVFSDMLDDGECVELARRMRLARHETSVVHVLGDEVLAPTVDGASRLVDAESGDAIDLVIDDAAMAQYRARLAAWLADTETSLRRAGVRYVPAFPGSDPVRVLAATLGDTA